MKTIKRILTIIPLVLIITFSLGCRKDNPIPPNEEIPIYYTWEIHLHNVVVPTDSIAFNNICEGLRRIGKVFQDHKIKVNFGVMEYFGVAVMTYQTPENNILLELEEMGHEIGGHSLGYYEDPSDILINELGFTPKYFNPAVAGRNTFEEQMQLIQDVFLSRNYKIMSDSYGWLKYSLGFNGLTYVWQPSFDTETKNIFVSDPNNDVIAINIQGNGWAGGRDIDIVKSNNFEMLKNLFLDFIEYKKTGKINIFPIGCHEDLFTTGPLMQEVVSTFDSLTAAGAPQSEIENFMQNSISNNYDLKDTDFSEEAIQLLDQHLTNFIAPLINEGIIVSKTYSEIYEIYFKKK